MCGWSSQRCSVQRLTPARWANCCLVIALIVVSIGQLVGGEDVADKGEIVSEHGGTGAAEVAPVEADDDEGDTFEMCVILFPSVEEMGHGVGVFLEGIVGVEVDELAEGFFLGEGVVDDLLSLRRDGIPHFFACTTDAVVFGAGL